MSVGEPTVPETPSLESSLCSSLPLPVILSVHTTQAGSGMHISPPTWGGHYATCLWTDWNQHSQAHQEMGPDWCHNGTTWLRQITPCFFYKRICVLSYMVGVILISSLLRQVLIFLSPMNKFIWTNRHSEAVYLGSNHIRNPSQMGWKPLTTTCSFSSQVSSFRMFQFISLIL